MERWMRMNPELTELQREALWKWRWLGIAKGTPAFQATLLVLEIVAFAIAIVAIISL
jgi:hypothetical protein